MSSRQSVLAEIILQLLDTPELLEPTLTQHRLSETDKVLVLMNIGNTLLRRFELAGAMEDLNQAIDTKESAVAIMPTDYSNYAMFMNNLANPLLIRLNGQRLWTI